MAGSLEVAPVSVTLVLNATLWAGPALAVGGAAVTMTVTLSEALDLPFDTVSEKVSVPAAPAVKVGAIADVLDSVTAVPAVCTHA